MEEGAVRLVITQYSYGQNTCASPRNNVIEFYKKWNADEVRADLQPNRSDMVTILYNANYNISIGSVIRSNNAFLGKEVYIVGRKKYDSRSAVGCGKYEHVYHGDDIQEVAAHLRGLGYYLVAVDNIEEYNPVSMYDLDFPRKTAFLYGNEGDGIPREAIELCDAMMYVRQRGSVRSMNVACCASVVMSEYTRRFYG